MIISPNDYRAQPHFYLFDTNAVLLFTYALARKYADERVVVPKGILIYLQQVDAETRREKWSYKGIVEKATEKGYIELMDGLPQMPERVIYWKDQLNTEEYLILKNAAVLQEEGKSFTVITDSPALTSVLEHLSIVVWSYKVYDKKRTPAGVYDHEFEKEITKVITDKWLRSIKKIATAIIFSLPPISLYYYLGALMTVVNPWLVLFLCLLAGVGLFLFREYNKAGYGLTEILVAIFSIGITIVDVNYLVYTDQVVRLNVWFKLLAGLYIFVRGMDNVVKGMKSTPLGVRLKRYGIGNS